MSPTRDMWISLTFELAPTGELLARLAVDEPVGRLVEAELTGDEVARLLAGETLSVPGEVAEQLGAEPAVEPDVVELELVHEEPEPAVVDMPATPARYSSSPDEPPAGTEPISRSTDVATGEAVVVYVRGRWRDAVVVRSDIGSVLVRYSRVGPFGRDVRQRVVTELVRRRI